jgi:acetyl/propionyl-CoA carboxylase alpha subunit
VFTCLLIANRGEIAIRIARAAADLGVATVAVYTADEPDAPHVAKADSAVALRGTGVAGYLDGDDVLRAAQEAGADAVHPGYGFLSENPDFAQACARRGLRFIGPSPEILARLGDKTRARELAEELDVPVLRASGRDGAGELLEQTGAVMVKAVAGGGGRGMRRVTAAGDLDDALTRCASEAGSAFGDSRVYVEELLAPARHVEVQILGDGTGAVTQLGDRDCSVQRRHQKIVEVAPSPGLDPAVRDALLAAAVRLGESVRYRGLGTVEFLVQRDRFAFIEVNPRLQVEHTITEEVTGVDLVAAQIQLAAGSTLAELGLAQDQAPAPRGAALQARITLEQTNPDGTSTPTVGTLTAFELPAGRGIRVDAAGYVGYRTSPRYDPLIAKLVVHTPSSDFAALANRAHRALSEVNIAGVGTNVDVLAGIVGHPVFTAGELTTDFLTEHLPEILAADRPHRFVEAPGDQAAHEHTREVEGDGDAIRAETPGTVVAVEVAEGTTVRTGQALLVLESMKMEHLISAPAAGRVGQIVVAPGDTVAPGDALLAFTRDDDAVDAAEAAADIDIDHVRPDLAEVLDRHVVGLDESREAAVAKRHRTGLRTARENLAELCDEGSFVEYGPLTIAAQRKRRSLDDLIERTPADGMLAGTATINRDLVGPEKANAVVVSYDYTVLAGTQGFHNHKKKDRIFEVAARRRWPVVVYAEGGGGRPGDTDGPMASWLDAEAFELFAKLSALVPLVGVVAGRCFAGNAALAGLCDVLIAVEGASIGMGGPAMIEGGGLGAIAPDDVGPVSVQVPNGVIDVLVADEAEATRVAKQYLSYFQGPVSDWEAPDQRRLRHVVPENRVRVYDMRAAIDGLADIGSVLELRREFGVGIITALVRVEGRPMGLIANDPTHLGGAIDHDAADKAARFLQLCDAFGLPVISLCDTPGFMVGAESETHATVRHFSRIFAVGANLTVPVGLIVTRKCYGLGAQAMMGGSLRAPAFTVSWPTGEFGPMGLEGAVRLGFRKELEAVSDPVERESLFQKYLAAEYEKGKALTVAQVYEVDDVIDPADTRRWITSSFPDRQVGPQPEKVRPNIDTW